MMILAIAVAIALAVATGIGVGSVPGLNENLHINLWFVIPISGAIAGMLLGLLQFGSMRTLGRPVRGIALGLLALGCVAGYAATEYGVYRSMDIEVADEAGATTSLPLSELMGFGDYLDLALSSSSYESQRMSSSVEYGRTGTTLTWLVDLLGALLGGLGTLTYMSGKTPFCDRCDVYKRKNQKLVSLLDADGSVEVLEQVHSLVAEGEYAGLIGRLTEVAKQPEPEKKAQAMRMSADERICPGCNEATLIGTVERKGNEGWEEVSELAFRIDSGTGETARLGPA